MNVRLKIFNVDDVLSVIIWELGIFPDGWSGLEHIKIGG